MRTDQYVGDVKVDDAISKVLRTGVSLTDEVHLDQFSGLFCGWERRRNNPSLKWQDWPATADLYEICYSLRRD